jgi:hypothetical protein
VITVMFGSRTWDDVEAVEDVFERLLLEADGALAVVTGANGVSGPIRRAEPDPPASSADAIADWVARRRGLTPVRVPADWKTHDRERRTEVPCRCAPNAPHCRAAGFRRNQRIVDEFLWPFEHQEPGSFQGSLVAVGFKRTDGPSPGTDDMRARIRPYVERGTVQGILRTAKGPAPAERRVPRRHGFEPSPDAELWPADAS